MANDPKKGPSQRQLRVGEQLRQILSDVLRRGHFTNEILLNSGAEITVTEVRPSPDLRHATAYILSLSGVDTAETVKALNEAAPYFQKEIGRSLSLKFTPRVRFVFDESFDEARRIDTILHSISRQGENG